MSSPKGYLFLVVEEPFCVWSRDLRAQSLDFLRGLDPTYFAYLAKVHGERLDEDAQQAAVALRTAYHHGLEAFFALLFAALQAPDAPFAWIHRAWPKHLRYLVSAVNSDATIPNKLGLEYVTWEKLSERVNLFRYDDPLKLAETQQLFASLWRSFAHDLTNQHHTDEYNGIKHGFRTHSGGFGLAVGIESTPGVPAPEENMRLVGSSKFGTSYLTVTPLGAKTPHFYMRSHSLNWSPACMISALQLAGMSINNVISCLRLRNGVPGTEVTFLRAEDSAAFDAPWQDSIGVTYMGLGETIDEREVALLSKEELRAKYDGR